ncbi:hypothetical protein GCM10027053_07280 [Intrasporangium mesophilum]
MVAPMSSKSASTVATTTTENTGAGGATLPLRYAGPAYLSVLCRHGGAERQARLCWRVYLNPRPPLAESLPLACRYGSIV